MSHRVEAKDVDVLILKGDIRSARGDDEDSIAVRTHEDAAAVEGEVSPTPT
jgi:hypothetical protein